MLAIDRSRPLRRRARAVAALLLGGLLTAPAPSRADEGGPPAVEVTRVSGTTVRARGWTGADETTLTFAADEGPVTIPRDDVVAITTGTLPDPPRAHDPDEVVVDLWSGEEILGRIEDGDEFGIRVRHEILGEVAVAVDAIAGLRFPHRLEQLAEPPDLSPGTDSDIVHLSGGDRINCTLESFGRTSLTCATNAREGVVVDYARVTAVRLMPTDDPPAARNVLTVVLRDGTRLRGTAPAVARGRLSLESVSGFTAKTPLTDVVAVLVDSDRVRYLSDIADARVVVKPFWEPVAGDPTEIYAPRRDRAFSGGLLQAGGRTWIKGLGVFSGTTLTYELDEAWRELRTQVAVDDAAGRLGAVVFVVLVDGEERWRSDLVVPASGSPRGRGEPGPLDAGRISLEGAHTLSLRVLPGDADDPYPIQDEADWLGAMLVR